MRKQEKIYQGCIYVLIGLFLIMSVCISSNKKTVESNSVESYQSGLIVGGGIENYKFHFQLEGDEKSLAELESIEKRLKNAQNVDEINKIHKELETLLNMNEDADADAI